MSATEDVEGNNYVFYVAGSSAYYARIAPGVLVQTARVFTSYSPTYFSLAQQVSHFIPLLFTQPSAAGTCTSPPCLYYSGYPLPLDGEAAVTNPWATKLGAPLVTDTGGTISPTTGLLAVGQPLIAGSPAISIIYREPGLFNLDGTKYPRDDKYQIVPGIYYDFPWIGGTSMGATNGGVLRMTGGQSYVLSQTGQSGGVLWFNITKGMRYTVKFDSSQWNVTTPSGAYMLFNGVYNSNKLGNLTSIYLDTTMKNYLTYDTMPGAGAAFTGTVMTASGRTIVFSDTGITYGNGQSIGFAKTLGPWSISGFYDCSTGTTTDSGKLQVTDAIGRVTTYWVCKWKLMRLESPNGGRVDYSYPDIPGTGSCPNPPTPVPTCPVTQGTEAYSYPVTKLDIYNESGANVKARSLALNWVFQNGEVVRALVNTTDKSAVVQGSNEYLFNSAAGTARVRTYDSAGQALYYDMSTCTASPCGTNPLKDLSGNANSGTFGGSGYTFPAGKYGGATGFGGAAYIQAADSASLRATSGVTLSAWINPSASDMAGTRRIISKWGSTNGAKSYLLSVGDWANGVIRFAVRGTSDIYADAVGYPVSASTWWYVVGTYDGVNARIYINGVLGGSVPGTATIQTTTTPVRIGWEGDGSVGYAFGGVIDEVRIFNRALSPEDIGILYTKNALKKGEQQNWYSINDMPHLAEGLVGDETTASVVTSDAIDDWGNQIYHRDALGNETFASYANTNHQNHFYAPGRLTKNTSTQFNTEFIDFSEGVFPTGQGTWSSLGVSNPTIDYAVFGKVAPSLRIDSTADIVHPLAQAPTFVDFRVRMSALKDFQVRFDDGTHIPNFQVQFDVGGQITANGWNSVPLPYCLWPSGQTVLYAPNVWYRFTIDINTSANRPLRLFMNGIALNCGTLLSTYLPNVLNFIPLSTGTWSAWVDDIKLYANGNGVLSGYDALSIGFDGLQPRQSIRLLAENGYIINQTMQTGTGTLWLSFNGALTGAYNYYENGDNAKTAAQIYAEDGTLEYQSPLTRFFVGERYAYTRPRAFADKVVKTASGALYIPNTDAVYADDSCSPSSITCYGFAWASPPTVPSAAHGTSVHVTPFGYGDNSHYFLWTQGGPLPNLPANFTTYVFLPSGRAPAGISLWLKLPLSGGGLGWYQAYWGVPAQTAPEPTFGISESINRGALPARDQWIRLWFRPADFFTGQTQWAGFGYSTSGGAAAWDATTAVASATSPLTVTGLSGLGSNLKVSIYDPVRGVEVANNSGFVSGDSTTIDFWPWYFAFPIQASIKICSSTFASLGCNGRSTETNEYYFGPLRNLWPGDSFWYAGASSFFDPKVGSTSYWPRPTVRTAQVGAKKFSGDCLSAALCYDMETMKEAATTVDTGAVQVLMVDLSGKGNTAVVAAGPVSSISNAAAGLGMNFNGATNSVFTTATPLYGVTASVTISAWAYLQDTSRNGPFVKVSAAFGTTDGYGLGVGSGSWDTPGNHLIGLYEGVRWIDTGASIGTGLHHVVMVISSTSVPSFYLDGNLVSGNFAGSGPRAPTTLTAIGGYSPDIFHPRFFGGTIDQVIIYSRVLSSTEIMALYQARMPGAKQVFLQQQPIGLPLSSRVPYEGTYLYAVATYDSKGNVLSVTDVGRNSSGGSNVTRYAYSTLDGRDYRTQVNRSDGKQIYYAYDFQSGIKYGTLGIDCRRSRTSYDVMRRPTQTSVYDTDANEVLHLDMETATYNSLKDVSCAGTQDSIRGQSVSLSGTTTAVGIDGMAQSFGGTNSYISAAHSTSLAFTTAYTLSAWFMTNSLTTQQGIVRKLAFSPTRGYSIQMMNDASLYAEVWNNGAVKTWRTAASTISQTGTWYHVAFTFSSGTGQVYLNGVAISSTVSGTQASVQDSGTSVYLGSCEGASCWLNGALDEVRLFNTARSASEISDLWQFKYKLLTSSAAAYDDMTAFPEFAGYPGTSLTSYDGVSTPRSLFFDMQTKKVTINSISYLEDLSGHGYSGKVDSTVTLGVTGKIGTAASFPGTTTGYVTGPAGFKFPTTTFSVAFWVYPTSLPASSRFFFGATNGGGSDAVYGYQSNGNFQCVLVNTAGTYYNTGNAALTLNQWNHVVCTFDGSSLKVYLNSVLQGTGGAFTGTPRTAQGDFKVGGYAGLTGITATLDEFEVVSKALSSTEVAALYNGYAAAPGSPTMFPAGNTGVTNPTPTTRCGASDISVDGGDWTSPTNAYSNNGVYATASPAMNTLICNEWNTFNFVIPDLSTITSVKATIQEQTGLNTGADWHISLQTDNGPTNCATQRYVPASTGVETVTFDFTSCKAWSPADFNLNKVRVDVGGHRIGSTAVTFSLDSVSIQVTYGYAPGPLYDGTHVSRVYNDGLGRGVRQVTMDMYNTRLTTVQTLGWNNQPVYAYLPSGQYSTFAYDFLGRTLSVQSPGDSTASGVSRMIVSEKARMVESVDAVGRKAYVKMDLLGRTVETAVWNVSSLAYGNLTSASYNALSEVMVSKDAKGQTTTTYYNSLGKPKMTVFPNGNYSVVYYDDNLRAFQTIDVMGRAAVSSYDILGRVTSVRLKPSISTDCAGSPNPCVVSYGYDTVRDDLLTIDNVTARITRTYDSLHRMKTEKFETASPVPGPVVFTGTITYAYDNASKVTDIQYPVSGTAQHAVYIYDSLGRPIEVDYGALPATKYAVLTYDLVGRLDNIHYWKGATDTTIQEKYSYDARDRVTQIKVFNGGSTTYMQLDYVYNKASDIVSSTDNMLGTGKSVTYGYDGNGRLSQAVGPWGSSEATEYDCYDYDAVGNMLHWRQGSTSCPTSGAGYYRYNDGASYPVWNKLNTMDYHSMSFTYNVAGSMTCKTESATNTRYVHDFQQQLVGVKTSSSSCTSTEAWTYTNSYDGLGRRITTYDGATTSYFMYAGGRMLYSKVGTAETAYVYVGGKLLLRKDASASQPTYYHQDLSADNVRLTTYYTASVQVEGKFRYRPFGEMITLTGSTDRFQYAQQESDSALRLYHMGARYHDPVVGRFIERDPIGPGYSYAANNPVSFIDPSGLVAQYGGFWNDLRNFLNSPVGKGVVLVVGVISIALLPPEAIALGIGLGMIFMAATAVLSGGKATRDDYVAAFSLGFIIGTVIGGELGFGVEREAGELGAAEPSLSGVAAETSAAAPAESGLTGTALSGGTRAATRPSIEEVIARGGFRGGAPGEVASDVEEALAATDRQSELAQAAKAWYKSTSPSEEASLIRHHTKHVLEELGDNPLELGTTPARYTRDAQKFFSFYKDSQFAQSVTLYDRSSGILIRLGEDLPGGYFTPEGRIVTFWYVSGVV